MDVRTQPATGSRQPQPTRARTAASAPAALIEQLRHGPTDPPFKRVRLERNSFEDCRQRAASGIASVAESYHENSKLFPALVHGLTAAATDADEFRRRVMQARTEAEAAVPGELVLAPSWHEPLQRARVALAPESFYALEVRIVAGWLVASLEPVSGRMPVVKRLTRAERDTFTRACELMPARGGAGPRCPAVVLLGRFVFNDVLFGARGYRRTLLEAGWVAHEIATQAKRAALSVTAIHEFTDHDIDAVMEADGVEEGTLLILRLERTDRVG